MFEHINKWSCILSFTYALISGQLFYMISFAQRHPALIYDIIELSILSTLGQIFVYRMIKQFKQHIVPFVITTRKIFTVVISILFYNHETTFLQIAAIILVFFTASFEYLSELYYSNRSTVSPIPVSSIPPSNSEGTGVSDDEIHEINR